VDRELSNLSELDNLLGSFAFSIFFLSILASSAARMQWHQMLASIQKAAILSSQTCLFPLSEPSVIARASQIFEILKFCRLGSVQGLSKLGPACDTDSLRFDPRPDLRIQEGMAIVDLGVCDIGDGHEWRWMNDTVHACLHGNLLCASLLWSQLETLDGKAFGNRDGENRDRSIHVLKAGTLDTLPQFQSLTDAIVDHLLDQQFPIPCS
jgi:hypothetical protein